MNTSFEYILPAIKDSQGAYIIITPVKVFLNLASVFHKTGTAYDLRLCAQFEDILSVSFKEVLVERAITHNDPVIASIDAAPIFEPSTADTTFQNQGRLRIPMNSRFDLEKGVHTINAIQSSMIWENDFANSTILLKILTSKYSTTSYNSFSDESFDEMDYVIDHTVQNYPDKIHLIAEVVVRMVRPFSSLTDLEHHSLPTRSSKLFTFNSIKNATKALLAPCISNSIFGQAKLASNYWFAVSTHMPEWDNILERKVSAGEIRQEYIHSHAPVLIGLGYLGAALLKYYPYEWQVHLTKIADINWLRSNPEWDGRIIIQGRVSKAQSSITLMTSYLKKFLNLPLSSEEQHLEDQLQEKRSSSI